MIGGRRDDPCSSSGGWVLIEVTLAVLLVAVLVVPLATALDASIGRAVQVEDRVRKLDEEAAEGHTSVAWTWGPIIASARWLPGPTLEMTARVSAQHAMARVGLWIDGWFQGEYALDPEGALAFGPGTWASSEGLEAIVRVRGADQGWGPLWRSLVPGTDGVVALGPPGLAAPSFSPTMVHPSVAASPLIEASWRDPAGESASGSPLWLEQIPSGRVGVAIDGLSQSWIMEPERALDVYF